MELKQKIASLNVSWLLFFIWLVLTLINLNKAYHIDDSFHLEFAQNLINDPLNPMSGRINWEDNPVPLKISNHPPLLFYLIAIYSLVFGESEIAMHILMSVFTFICLYLFIKISDYFKLNNKSLLLLLFAFNPVFIVNQNLMLDVPLLASILSAIYFLLLGVKNESKKCFFFSIASLTVGFFIKYSILPLFPVVFLVLIIHKRYYQLLYFLIPITLVVLWSMWNLYEFDGIHLLGRKAKRLYWHKPFGFLICIGALTFLWFYLIDIKNRMFNILKVINAIILILGLFLSYFEVVSQKVIDITLIVLFFTNGIALFIVSLNHIYYQKIKKQKLEYLKSNQFIILLVISAISVFITIFSAFIATRHILLIIPFLVIFLSDLFTFKSRNIKYVIPLILLFGILHGASDWYYADFYRQKAKELSDSNKKIWSAGHWGWQYYSQKNGMNIYATDLSKVKVEDLIIYPLDVPRQKINDDIKLKLVKKVTEPAPLITIISGKNNAAMYSSSIIKSPWTFSKASIDTLEVYKVVDIKTE